MSHPYKQHKNAGKSRVSDLYGKMAKGGAVQHSDAAEDASMVRKAMADHDKQLHGGKHTDLSNISPKSKGRMDKYARGGKVKGGGKHHTKINIVVAPKAGGDVPPPVAPPMGGPPPGGPPPMMPPKTPMGPPPSPMAGGMPGLGGMKRGGGVKSGISSKENLSKWADYAKAGTKYASGGKVKSPLKASTGGGDSGGGRLAKVRSYGKNARKKG